MRSRLSAKAAEELLDILKFIARDDPGAAARFHTRVLEALAVASRFPEAGRRVPEQRDSDLREMIVAPYRVIYRRLHDGILAVAVCHGARRSPLNPKRSLR